MHTHTPTLRAYDARRLAVRTVAYLHNEHLTDPKRLVIQQHYDALGRPTEYRDPRLFAMQAPANLRQIMALSGTVLLADSVDAGATALLIGEAGQPLERWDAKLNHSRLQYDRLLRPSVLYETANGEGQTTSEYFSYGSASVESAQHNQCGRLIRKDDGAGTLLLTEYSLAGEPLEQSRRFLVSLEDPDWPLSEDERNTLLEPGAGTTTQRHCNAVGELLTQTDAMGNTQLFEQTLNGHIKHIHLALAHRSSPPVVLLREIDYNAEGQIERQITGNGVVSLARYAADDGRLLQLTSQAPGRGVIQKLDYTHDPVGNILSVADSAQPIRYARNQRIVAQNHYGYDTLYRLINASGRQQRNNPPGPHLPPFQSPNDPGQVENYTRTYTYDAGCNLHHMAQTAGQSFSHALGIAPFSNRGLAQKQNGQIPSHAEIAAAHDANGNLLTLQPGQGMGWDRRNRLRCVDQVVRPDGPNDTERYVYDSAGERVRKVRTASTAHTLRTHEVRYLPGLELRTTPDQTLHVIHLQVGLCQVQALHRASSRAAHAADDQYRYTLTDHLGSCCMELDADANLVSQESYYPYGGTAYRGGTSEVQASYKTRRYCAKERDATGLYYYGRRYYAPWLQRWISADPAGVAAGMNFYTMVDGNPIGKVDEQGLITIPASVKQTAAAIGSAARAFAGMFSRPRAQAAAAAAIRDGMSTYLSNAVAAGVDQVFANVPATRVGNDALRLTVAALDGLAVGYMAGGLAGNVQRGLGYLVAPLAGLIAGVGYILNQSQDAAPDEEWDPIARARLGGHIRAITRELFQQSLRGVGTSAGWGSTPLPQRLGRTSAAATTYGLATIANAMFNQEIPDALQPNIAPFIEAFDGAAGTLIRSGREGATIDPPGDVAQAPDAASTAPNALGRMFNQVWGYWGGQVIEAIAQAGTGTAASEQNSSVRAGVAAARGVVSALTEFRGWLVQAARNGYANGGR